MMFIGFESCPTRPTTAGRRLGRVAAFGAVLGETPLRLAGIEALVRIDRELGGDGAGL